MKWSYHLAVSNSVGHGGARLYKAEVAFGVYPHRSLAGVDTQYLIIAHDTIQVFIGSPGYKRIVFD